MKMLTMMNSTNEHTHFVVSEEHKQKKSEFKGKKSKLDEDFDFSDSDDESATVRRKHVANAVVVKDGFNLAV